MQDLARQRCFNHSSREAVAICLDCNNPFCRECVTEHEDRVICAGCLSGLKADKPAKKRTALLRPLIRTALFFSALLFLWLIFFYLGRFLLEMPASFHEGTLWENLWQSI
ncbi:MAG: hypothetical protein MI863_04255 [Desulfobacterales bacterium]|nr:hypothetical protein [Desulfobacterales bacterium]